MIFIRHFTSGAIFRHATVATCIPIVSRAIKGRIGSSVHNPLSSQHIKVIIINVMIKGSSYLTRTLLVGLRSFKLSKSPSSNRRRHGNSFHVTLQIHHYRSKHLKTWYGVTTLFNHNLNFCCQINLRTSVLYSSHVSKFLVIFSF